MMQGSLLLGLLFGVGLVTAEQSGRTCSMGEWSTWSTCRLASSCTRRRAYSQPEVGTFSMPVTSQKDRGRDQMALSISLKEKQWSETLSCSASEANCVNPPSLGIHPCDDVSGRAADRYACRLVDMMSFVSISDLGYPPERRPSNDHKPMANDIWGWVDPLNNQHYAIIGLSGGTSFVRITQPDRPVVVGFLPTRTMPSSWRDIKVIGNVAYIVAEAPGHGMQAFDLTRLRGINSLRRFTLSDAVDYTRFGHAHNIVENSETNTLVVVGSRVNGRNDQGEAWMPCNGGLHIIDVSSPLNPQYAGCYGDDGYTHDAQCVIYKGPDIRYKGREICFAYNEDSLTIVDITDRSNTRVVSKSGYDHSSYTHQGWLTEDHEYLLLDDELDEIRTSDKFAKTFLWSVKNLVNPFIVRKFSSWLPTIDHNQYILSRNFTNNKTLVYQSNYGSGLRIQHLDLNPSKMCMKEVAYFDVLPHDTQAQFYGTWSNYPFFPTGIVAVSSIEYGLFVLRPRYETILQNIDLGITYCFTRRTRSVTESGELPHNCEHQEEYKECMPCT